MRLCLNRVFDYISKAATFKRSSAHQCPIHIRLAHELPRIGRFDASTILDSDAAGNRFVKELGQLSPNKSVRFLGLGGGGGFPGADGPDRLVSDDRLRHLVFTYAGQAPLDLSLKHVFRLTTFALVQRLAYADNRLEGCAMGR